MEKKVLDFIDQHHIVGKGSRIVLAVSGGADSMALAHFMVTQFPDLELGIAHMNHGLRPEADEEEAFVGAFAKERKIPFFCHRADIAALAKERKQGIEETAREERYRFLRSLGADLILTAHHKNDQAETVLLHILRGCGLKGLGGMEPICGDIARPFLCVTKEEILAYCEKNSISYKTDLSNEDTVYTRNKIRKEIVPLLAEINPNVTEALYRLAESAAADHLYLEGIAENYDAEYCFEKDGYQCVPMKKRFAEEPVIARRVVRMAAERCGVIADFDHTEKILSLENGKGMPIAKGIWVYRDGDMLRFGPRRVHTLSAEEISVPEYGKIELDNMVIKTEISASSPLGNVSSLGIFDTDMFDTEPPLLRHRRTGDYVVLPDGRHKKLSDYFIDEKIPCCERDSILLLAAGNRVLWVIGHRIFAPKGEENLIVDISVKF